MNANVIISLMVVVFCCVTVYMQDIILELKAKVYELEDQVQQKDIVISKLRSGE